MKKLNFVAAAVLAASSFAASAATINAAYDGVGTFTFENAADSFAAGSDTVNFVDAGFAAGTYDFTLTFSGQNFTWNPANPVVLNGVVGEAFASGKFRFAGVDGSASTPLVLTLLANTVANKAVTYSGELTVTAVPEPTTYALLLAGLGAVGFVARRRKAA